MAQSTEAATGSSALSGLGHAPSVIIVSEGEIKALNQYRKVAIGSTHKMHGAHSLSLFLISLLDCRRKNA
jgi:hypothetical protein